MAMSNYIRIEIDKSDLRKIKDMVEYMTCIDEIICRRDCLKYTAEDLKDLLKEAGLWKDF